MYDAILNEEGTPDADRIRTAQRQIIYFNPAGDGTMAELHGRLDSTTKNVGIFVPGTGHSMDDWRDSAERSVGFLEASKGLAMITWIGSDLPNSVMSDAPDKEYALAGAPALAEFSHQLRSEINRVGSPADIAPMGHSYGAALLGRAQTEGLDADRILMIEGAGTGPGVRGTDDLPVEQRKVPRYSMTAPEDFIGHVQGNSPLGADPDTFGNTTRLQTGYDEEGEPIDGAFASHSDVFNMESDAWWNMHGFLNKTQVTLMAEPTIRSYPGPVTDASLESGGTVKVR